MTAQPTAAPTSCCTWCGNDVASSELSCPSCGATVQRSRKTTRSGWTELPAIKDMARLRIGNSTCQIEGTYVPVADFNLAPEDSLYFSHHVLLWKDPQVELKRMSMKGAFTRMMAGLPLVMTEAHGPGHVAFSRDEAGEVVALPLHEGQGIDVREHLFLVATSRVAYAYFNTGIWYTTQNGNDTETHYPAGQFFDRFTARGGPGLLLLHASGNVFVRELVEGQTLLIKPTALVFKDRTVQMELEISKPMGSWVVSHRMMWLRLTGHGRVAIQSAYEPMEDAGRTINSQSPRVRYSTGNALPQNLTPGYFNSGQNQPTASSHIDVRLAAVRKLVAEAMIHHDDVSEDTIAKLVEAAAQYGMSSHDVRMIVNQLKAQRRHL